jgi:hypothetical protein
MRVRGNCGQRADANQRHDRVAGQDGEGRSGRRRGGWRDTAEDRHPAGNGSGVPYCGGCYYGDDRGGLGCLPAVATGSADGGDRGAPGLCGAESVGYPDGQASAGGSFAVQTAWQAPPPALPSVGRPMPPRRFTSLEVFGYSCGQASGGRDGGSSQEPGRHVNPLDPGDLPGRQG